MAFLDSVRDIAEEAWGETFEGASYYSTGLEYKPDEFQHNFIGLARPFDSTKTASIISWATSILTLSLFIKPLINSVKIIEFFFKFLAFGFRDIRGTLDDEEGFFAKIGSIIFRILEETFNGIEILLRGIFLPVEVFLWIDNDRLWLRTLYAVAVGAFFTLVVPSLLVMVLSPIAVAVGLGAVTWNMALALVLTQWASYVVQGFCELSIADAEEAASSMEHSMVGDTPNNAGSDLAPNPNSWGSNQSFPLTQHHHPKKNEGSSNNQPNTDQPPPNYFDYNA